MLRISKTLSHQIIDSDMICTAKSLVNPDTYVQESSSG